MSTIDGGPEPELPPGPSAAARAGAALWGLFVVVVHVWALVVFVKNADWHPLAQVVCFQLGVTRVLEGVRIVDAAFAVEPPGPPK